MEHRAALGALRRAYGGVTDVAAGLPPGDLLAFSRCRGWVIVDVLFHLLCDAQRALVALASPAPGPPDRDFVSYWAGFAAEAGDADDPAPEVWWVRRSAAAFRDGTGVVMLWRETAPAAVRAAERADPDGHVATQGHVLAVPDFLATLATEAVVHHLDMTVDLPDAPEPAPEAVDMAARTLDGLLGADVSRPARWSETEYLLKGTGRQPLSTGDRDALGPAAALFPLLS
jgi:hypothetical protein